MSVLKSFVAGCFAAVLGAGCASKPTPEPVKTPKVVTVCSGCGSEWTSVFGTGDHKPITKCPNCPMTPEEFEELKDQVRKRLEAERKAKEATAE